jgi:hypothetical protein
MHSLTHSPICFLATVVYWGMVPGSTQREDPKRLPWKVDPERDCTSIHANNLVSENRRLLASDRTSNSSLLYWSQTIIVSAKLSDLLKGPQGPQRNRKPICY